MTEVAERTIMDAAQKVAEAVGDELVAAYLVGSAAQGQFVPHQSDLDVIAVVARRLAGPEKEAIAERARRVDVSPARGLELVVWARGERDFELNLDPTHVGYGPEGEPFHWFVLARAMAEQHAVNLAGPPWSELFDPVPREAILDALAASLDWHDRYEPASRNAALNAARALAWLEGAGWLSKQEAGTWLSARARAALKAGRR